MPHFFINSQTISKDRIQISEKETYMHLAKSLRVRVGENLLLIDENRIQYECRISEITSEHIEAEILKRYKSEKSLNFELYLAQTPLRSNSQDLIIEKATELGVRGIYPIFTDNCAVKKEI